MPDTDTDTDTYIKLFRIIRYFRTISVTNIIFFKKLKSRIQITCHNGSYLRFAHIDTIGNICFGFGYDYGYFNISDIR